MSSLTGHYVITSTAVKELAKDWNINSFVAGMLSDDIAKAAMRRDVIDVLTRGHWTNDGQKHHFMREFSKQSEYQAYRKDVGWIYRNALNAAQRLWHPASNASPQKGIDGSKVSSMFLFVWLQPLGNAIHALEDSFAPGHVVREDHVVNRHLKNKQGVHRVHLPSAITSIKIYSGSEVKKSFPVLGTSTHEQEDEMWHTKKSNSVLSWRGKLAVLAVKDLIKMVVLTAQISTQPHDLEGWMAFREKWLKASPELKKK